MSYVCMALTQRHISCGNLGQSDFGAANAVSLLGLIVSMSLGLYVFMYV